MATPSSSQVMRAISLFVFLLSSIGVIAQGITSQTSKRIKITSGVHRLDSLLKQISKESGVTFSFNAKKIDAAKIINWKLKEGTLKEILNALEKEVEFEAMAVEDHIVLVSRPKPQKKGTPRLINSHPTVKPPIKKVLRDEHSQKKPYDEPTTLTRASNSSTDTNEPKFEPPLSLNLGPIQSLKTISPDSLNPAIVDQAEPNEKTFAAENEPAPSVHQPIDSVASKMKLPEEHIVLSPDALKNKKQKKVKSFFIKAGIVTHETLYTNGSVQVGLPLIYGTASIGTNFKVTQFNFGGGTSIKVNETWRLNMQLEFGKTSRSFRRREIDTTGVTLDSTLTTRVKVTSKSTRLNIFIERRIFKNFTLQLGPTFTIMKTEYFANNKSVEAGRLGENADRKYRTVSAPLLLSNSYKSTSRSNLKTWIGLQVGLFYKIPSW